MKKRCLIISGGKFCLIDDYTKSDYVIACDRGCEYARRCGIPVDLALGDFDSYHGEIIADEIIRCRPEKDDTDTMMAIRQAVSRGFEHISIRCALGGRMDHLIANLQSLSFAADHGVTADITDSNNFLQTMLPGRLLLPRRPGFSLSLFSLTERCGGLSLSGVKYPLSYAEISSTFPIGVSNEWLSECAEIEFESGALLIVQSRL